MSNLPQPDLRRPLNAREFAERIQREDARRSYAIALEDAWRPLSAHVHIFDQSDVLEVYGVKFAGRLLRALALPTPPGMWFRVDRIDENGVGQISIQIFEEPKK